MDLYLFHLKYGHLSDKYYVPWMWILKNLSLSGFTKMICSASIFTNMKVYFNCFIIVWHPREFFFYPWNSFKWYIFMLHIWWWSILYCLMLPMIERGKLKFSKKFKVTAVKSRFSQSTFSECLSKVNLNKILFNTSLIYI